MRQLRIDGGDIDRIPPWQRRDKHQAVRHRIDIGNVDCVDRRAIRRVDRELYEQLVLRDAQFKKSPALRRTS